MKRVFFLGSAIICGVLLDWGLGYLAQAVDREYILVISQPDKTEIGVVQAGLTKAQAEGLAFQLNEAFRGHGVPVSVRAKQPTDIGNYHPKPK